MVPNLIHMINLHLVRAVQLQRDLGLYKEFYKKRLRVQYLGDTLGGFDGLLAAKEE